jgi:hypothetical protein
MTYSKIWTLLVLRNKNKILNLGNIQNSKIKPSIKMG